MRRQSRCDGCSYRNAGCGQQSVEIFVGLVARLVAPAAADEIADIAEILTDHEEVRAAVAEPLLPMADDVGVEVEFGATPDPARTALDTDAAGLAPRYQRLKLGHARPTLGPARPNGEQTIRKAELLQVLQCILEIIAARAAAASGSRIMRAASSSGSLPA